MPQAANSAGIDPKLPTGTNYCRCSACGEYFNSVVAFEKHRIGVHRIKGRKCRSKAQMKARGMSVNHKGYWITQKYDSSPHQPRRTDDRPEVE